MFPSLKARFGTLLLDQMDAALEFSTLGSYGLSDDRRPLALDLVEEPGEAVSSGDRRPAAATLELGCRAAARRTRDRCGDALSPPRDRRGGPARP